ncbi:uncharacterized protein LOC120273312 [Dioscorea cayenensis subsp. rotundata]|uniref:Uncharacterized protein LOC120273312 n=1 Tax=Dioscorea cayennensis subsp. rotundata TaxID=55577 RepID=A0AB40C9T3_DIOCR|nr:uncharacterized protein LOC120273312 [Dioscorea cayenensis subsp. rotundata]
MANKTMVLKLLIDTKANRVLFAEAGKEVVDFLFTLLGLPLGSIVKLLSKSQMIGSIGNIYSSLENLDFTYIQPHQDKDILLSPQVKEQKQCENNLRLLLPDPAKVEAYYRCRSCRDYVSKVCGIECPSCSGKMDKMLRFVHESGMASGMASGNGVGEEGLVKGVVTYTIMDDLTVTPMSTISGITLLSKFNVKNVDVLMEKNISLGMQEVVFQFVEYVDESIFFTCFCFQALELLKASLASKTVLTDVFLAGKQ